MSFKEIVNQAKATSQRETDGGIRDWRSRHARFRRINTRQCPDLSYEEVAKIVSDLNWVYKAHNSHPIFYNEWLGETHPIHNRSLLNKERVAHLSRQMGFTLLDIERKVKKEVRQLYFLERAMEAFPEKRERLEEILQDQKDSILPYDYLREEYFKYRSEAGLTDIAESADAPAEPQQETQQEIYLEVMDTEEEEMDSQTSGQITAPAPAATVNPPPAEQPQISAPLVSAPIPWALAMTPVEKTTLLACLMEAKKSGIDPLLAIIALAHDMDISFERVRHIAADLDYQSHSARGIKTTVAQREEIIQLINTQLVEKDYTYNRYWSLVYATALAYRMWPKSVEKIIQIQWNYQFERPERPDPLKRFLPTEKLFPGLLLTAASGNKNVTAALPPSENKAVTAALPKPSEGKKKSPSTSTDLGLQVETQERRIVVMEKRLSLDVGMLRKLLAPSGISLGENVSLSVKDDVLSISWSEQG